MTARGTLTVALAIGAVGVAAGPAAAIRAGQPGGGRPQLDARSGERAPVPSHVQDARRALAGRLGIEGHVSTDPIGGGIRVLDRTNGFLSGPTAGDAAVVALAWVRAHATVFGLADADIAALKLVDRTTSNDGVTHLTWVPTSQGVPAYDGELRVHVARDGRVIAASGPPLGGLSIRSATPRLTASQALDAAQGDVGATTSIPRAATHAGIQRRTTFSNGDSARLVAFQSPSGDRLAWRVTVAGQGPYWFDEVIDANTGGVLSRRNLTRFAVDASVFDYHPGAAQGGTAHTVDISRWLSPSATTLTGPNAQAYADVNNDDEDNGGADSGGEDTSLAGEPFSLTLFPGTCAECTWNGSTSSESINRSQVTTQIFYFVNNFHDWLAQPDIGFTSARSGPNDESGGNFEGNDPVLAEADDSALASGRSGPFFNNANMSTLPDGQSPRMQMYLFEAPFPDVNGGDDASIVYHEYTHGLSNRLIDDANGLNENQGQAMGEGWSDWYAMDYLVAQDFVNDTSADGEVVVGEYATGDTSHGIRNQPLDCSVGSSAPSCGGSPTTAPGGFTFADLGRVGSYSDGTPRFEVHDDGEIWSETLWDLRKALGPFTARKLITNAMRLSPADPTFLDERDAILLADEADGGANHDAIWQVFAARGMGYGAQTTSPNATRAIASFETPRLAEPAGGVSVDDSNGLGDGDGAPEPGEAALLHVALADPGLVALTHVHATLSSPDAGVFVGQPDGDYGTIAAGDSAASATPYAIALQSTVTCGQELPLTLHVTSDQGTIDLPLTIPIGGGRATFASTDASQAIPDDSLTGATSTVTVPSAGRIDNLRVNVDAGHTWVGDLHAQLTSPAGTTVDLLERPGFGAFGSSLHWSGDVSGHGVVTFRDDAANSIQEIGDGPGALAGAYKPDEPLGAFAGEDRAGTWTLRVTDLAAGLTGTLNGWSLDADGHACSTDGTLPTVVTGDATSFSPTVEQLAGTVDRGGRDAITVWQYGTTTDYGQRSDTMAHPNGSGLGDAGMTITGLTPGTTYHYRLVSLLGTIDGPVVAVGADRTFTTATVSSGGGGGAGSGGGGGGGSGSGGGGSGGGGNLGGGSGGGGGTVSVAAPSGEPGKATLDAHSAFAFAFHATAGLHGTVHFTLPKHGRTKAIAFGGRSFVVGKSGRVKLTVKLGGRALAQLRRLHSAKVLVTIVLDGRPFRFTLKLSAPRPRRRR